jgi:endonuclease/exonuclease/phosphatase family metal-dependent hydrolase
MKLLSLNVWQGRLERVLLKHLEALEVDFACMQEAVDISGQSLGLVTSYQKVGKSLKLDQQFFSQLISTKFGNKDMVFGNVTYSSVPFAQTSEVFTRGHHSRDHDFDAEDYNIRAFQHTVIVINGKKLNLINHHGHHIDEHKLGDSETERQVSQIIDYIQGLDGAVILCGDFNLSPESQSIKLIEASLENMSTKYSLNTTRSNLTYKKEVCDYIFVNDQIKVNNFAMDTTIISDHNALIIDFDLL